MLRIEDYGSGAGCTELQKEFHAHWKQLEPVRKNKLQRRFLQLAAFPKPVDQSNPQEKRRKFVAGTFDPDRLIVDHREVDVYVMLDRFVNDGRTTHRVETLILGETAYLDRKGLPRVGGNEHENHSIYDFAELPFQPFQNAAMRCMDRGELKAPRGGTLRYRRIGDNIDICIDQLGYSDTPLIVYRIAADAFPESARLEHSDVLPANGETMFVKEVARGDTVVRLLRNTVYIKAFLDDKHQATPTTTVHKTVPAHREREFRLFLEMSQRMLEHTVTLDNPRPQKLSSPDKWAWRILFEFEDVRQLIYAPGFVASPATKQDLLSALGPSGLRTRGGRWYLYVRSCVDAEIEAVHPSQDGTDTATIRFDTGDEQVVPYYETAEGCNLFVQGPKGQRLPLTPGLLLRRDQVIGDFCPRIAYRCWETLQAVLGGNELFAVEEFLNSRAVLPGTAGWDGPGLLLDYRYCAPQAGAVACRDATDAPLWYWDLRPSAQYLAEGGVHIICPPIRFNDRRRMTIQLNGVSFFLGEPKETRRYKRGRSRRKLRRRFNQNQSQSAAT